MTSRTAEIAARAVKEIRYHLRHVSQWVVRLGDGTDESHDKMQQVHQRSLAIYRRAVCRRRNRYGFRRAIRGPRPRGYSISMAGECCRGVGRGDIEQARRRMDGCGRQTRPAQRASWLLAGRNAAPATFSPGCDLVSANISRDQVLEWLSEVPDPEIPVLTITDLGIVRDVTVNGEVVVALTPTYTGCPATEVIEQSVVSALHEHGVENVSINRVLSPPWTTDWISEKAATSCVIMALRRRSPAAASERCCTASDLSLVRVVAHANQPGQRIWFNGL